MKSVVLITARMGSSRLPGMHLKLVLGQPILNFLIARVRYAFAENIASNSLRIVIATSDLPDNRKFEEVFGKELDIFYGSDKNIPLRHQQAAEAYGADAVVSIDGDASFVR